MARSDPHVWDLVADDLADWLDEMEDVMASAIIGGGRAPFSAQADDQAKRQYFQSEFWLPDGQPNQEGRQRVLDRHGIKGYTEVWKELEKASRVTTAADEELI
jgi:hypothetical protein